MDTKDQELDDEYDVGVFMGANSHPKLIKK